MRLRRRDPTASVAQQILVLQLVVLVLVVAGSLALAYTDARRDADDERHRAGARRGPDRGRLAAHRPGRRHRRPVGGAAAVRGERAARHRHRLRGDHGSAGHPLDPPRSGQHRQATSSARSTGPSGDRDQTERYTGTLGPSIRAVVPVLRDGQVIGLVSVGHHRAARSTTSSGGAFPQLALAALAVLVVGVLGAVPDQPAAAAADPRPRRAARSPGCMSTTTPCCTRSARACCCSTARAGSS